MKSHSRLARRPHLALLGVPLAVALAGGCDAPAEITRYETPRTQPRVVAVDPAQVRTSLDHMFAAVIPAGKTAWFFKLVAPDAAAADDVRQPFDDFIATVDVGEMIDVDAGKSADKQVDHPAWKLPEGWTEQPGGEMRAATILVPHGDARLEITVSTLPLNGAWTAFLQANVDRWMGQLQQPPLDDATITKLAREVVTAKGKATVLELVGTMKSNPMGAGLAGLPPGHPPATGRTPLSPPVDAEADAPSSPEGTAAAAGDGAGLTYDAPADWQAASLNTGMFPREASFTVADADGKADLAVTRFAAHGEMAAPGPNVRRWAGQVGVLDLTDEDIKSAAVLITVDGESALQFEFFSPDGTASPQGILAVMAVRGDEVWFVKLFGDKPTVENQRNAFDAFLKSIRFNHDD